MSKLLDQAKKSARELKNAVAEFEVTNAALMGAIEKKYSNQHQRASATNTNAPQFTVNDKPHTDVLANYERV